ncbi:Uridine kinase [Lachnospiraceae bacterium TWA4]|nr:Uridine kinase [Lachnospiraceae bacterium TWA4]
MKTYRELAKEIQSDFEEDILLAEVDGKLSELSTVVGEYINLRFITAKEEPGMKAYERSLLFMMLRAIFRVAGRKSIKNVWVRFAITHGVYVEIEGNVTIDESFIMNVKEMMNKMVTQDLPIEKTIMKTQDAQSLFASYNMTYKQKLLNYRRSSAVNIYRLGDFEDYFYGYMVPSTGYLKYFDLCSYEQGLVLLFPTKNHPKEVSEFKPQSKLFQTLKESINWRQMLDVNTVGDLNDVIARGEINDLILVQEALQEKKLADIAVEIKNRKDCKFVMLAGPSSSGKTTTSHRLCVQLRANGMIPHQISVDNYFVDREFTPIDENGEYDFESIDCVDLKLFNQHMKDLLDGKSVQMPTFNFKEGRKEYHGEVLKLGPEDILVIEGIHALNDQMSVALPRESKFKIYLSALTQLCIDEHNRIPTTDGRLIRRIVRDARTRGSDAKDTIARWSSVRKGEDKNIFPYQEEADIMFNSASIYELAALKVIAEPLLYGVPVDCPEHIEAKRLLKFLDYFLGIDTAMIPMNSIVREFVGGSCFNV